jgi:hypothetical protein
VRTTTFVPAGTTLLPSGAGGSPNTMDLTPL